MSRPSMRAVVANFATYEAPLPTKVALALRNAAKRLTGQTCCGHPGQPGC